MTENKKEEDKKESKPQTLKETTNKIEDKKPVNKITSSQNSSIKARMTLFEKKFNNSESNRINPPVIKRVQTTNILSNLKYSDFGKKLTDQMQTDPKSKIESKKQQVNIIAQKEDPYKLIMNKPTVNKKTIKKKPKKINFS